MFEALTKCYGPLGESPLWLVDIGADVGTSQALLSTDGVLNQHSFCPTCSLVLTVKKWVTVTFQIWRLDLMCYVHSTLAYQRTHMLHLSINFKIKNP